MSLNPPNPSIARPTPTKLVVPSALLTSGTSQNYSRFSAQRQHWSKSPGFGQIRADVGPTRDKLGRDRPSLAEYGPKRAKITTMFDLKDYFIRLPPQGMHQTLLLSSAELVGGVDRHHREQAARVLSKPPLLWCLVCRGGGGGGCAVNRPKSLAEAGGRVAVGSEFDPVSICCLSRAASAALCALASEL